MQHTALKAGRRAMSWQRGLLALVLSEGLLLPSATPAAADAPGEIIVQPAAGVTIEQVNLKYRT
ncbi:MAG: hypothetical protein H0V51_20735, partial [Chloroflexi bacterium]|nr:hypothetical protein [Chloroflexota bacterium]